MRCVTPISITLEAVFSLVEEQCKSSEAHICWTVFSKKPLRMILYSVGRIPWFANLAVSCKGVNSFAMSNVSLLQSENIQSTRR